MKITLGNKVIGDGQSCFIIAEGGINHQGELKIAKQLVDKAKQCGVDCIKFQKRTINRILTKEGLEMPYVNQNSFGPTYGEHKQALELSFEEFKELKNYADKVGILFTASGWDEESIDFLDEIGVPFFKMASADLTNFPLLEHVAKKGKPMIISTGMADMNTVRRAYNLITQYNQDIVILQCTSSYPTPFNEIHLNVIRTLRREFPEAIIGYSGHENGLAVSLAACVMGAKVIERHFTLDRTMKGGDHAASLEPTGLSKLVRDIRVCEEAFGSSHKDIQPSEDKCMKKLRKSVVSTVKITSGTVVTREMLTTKGPGTGISPMDLESLVGKVVTKNIEADVILHHNSFL